MAVTGTCLCGEVGFEVRRGLYPLVRCHCSQCRKAHGVAFSSYAGAPRHEFHWLRGRDAIRQAPGPWLLRYPFCSGCGSTVPADREDLDLALIPAGLLKDVAALAPMMHILAGSKAPWYEITDSDARFEEFPPGWDVPPPPITRHTEPCAEAVRGGCLCGAVAYEIERPLAGAIVFCHCSRCRRGRAAAHNTNMVVAPERFRFLRGQQHVHSYKPPEALRFTQAFCRDCGSPMPHVGETRVIVPAGSLDDDPGIRPGFHIFVNSKALWFQITDELPQYPEAPPPELMASLMR